MKLSWNWLNEFIDLSHHSVDEIAELLTMKTCEVERSFPFLPHLKDVLVAEVSNIKKHPNADKLRICDVIAGKKKYTIVTGANNVIAKQKYPLVVPGSILPDGRKIHKTNLRGIDSHGMLCSTQEIGLEDFIFSEKDALSMQLLEIPNDLKTGHDLLGALKLKDFILEIDNKSITHRPDLWGHFGFAREISAILRKPLKWDISKILQKKPKGNSKDLIPVEILGEAALSYCFAILEGVEAKISPIELQARLICIGMKPINNMVDISNYVMLELGQPNHAFDRNCIRNKINISLSKKGEKIMTLDSKEYTIPEGIVLIKDGQKPIALGGVIGGKGTEINENTKSIFLESATFHRGHIRKAVNKLGIRTESSQRFEKGLCPSLNKFAIHRFIELLKKSCPDLKTIHIGTQRKEKIKSNVIHTKISYLKGRLDFLISAKEIIDIFTSLGMKCDLKEDNIKVRVPDYRSYFDLEIADDLVEELGRMLGYKNANPKPLSVYCKTPSQPYKNRQKKHFIRKLFSYTYHFTEVYNYCFHSHEDIQRDTRYSKNAIEIKNPIHSDLKFMRISPAIGLLKNIAANKKKYKEMRLYEMERIFIPVSKNKREIPLEKKFFSGVLISMESSERVLYHLSSILNNSLVRLGLAYHEQKWDMHQDDLFHPGRCGIVTRKKDDILLYKWGEIHPRLTKSISIDGRVYYFEALLGNLFKIDTNNTFYKPVPKYPSADFEFTIIADNETPFKKIIDAIGESNFANNISKDETHLEDIRYIGSYQGEPIPFSKKAISIQATWRNHKRTIEHTEFKKLQDAIIHKLRNAGFPLR